MEKLFKISFKGRQAAVTQFSIDLQFQVKAKIVLHYPFELCQLGFV